MMLAHGEHLDVFYHNHLIMILIEYRVVNYVCNRILLIKLSYVMISSTNTQTHQWVSGINWNYILHSNQINRGDLWRRVILLI